MTPCSSTLSTVVVFLKRPQAFPILLSVFVLLTWLSLRLQSPGGAAFGLRPPASPSQAQGQSRSQIARDRRGWLLNPIAATREARIHGKCFHDLTVTMPCCSTLSAVAVFLKRPQAFPILLSVFVLLTWLSLCLQSPGSAAFGLRSPPLPPRPRGSAVPRSPGTGGGGFPTPSLKPGRPGSMVSAPHPDGP